MIYSEVGIVKNEKITGGGQRLLWLDYLKGFAMLMIILSHCGAPDIYRRIYTPFFLTIYFFAAGYTLNLKNSFFEYFKGKVKSLVIPLVSLGSINAILAVLFDGDSLLVRMRNLFVNRNCIGDDMWFIACLFSAEIVIYPIIRYMKTTRLEFAASGILLLFGQLCINLWRIKFPWQFELACALNVFLILGTCFRKYSQKLQFLINRKWFLIFLLLYLLLALGIKNDVNIHSERFDKIILFYVTSTLGIMVLVLGAQMLKMNIYLSKILIFIGQNTLVYYAFQSKAIKAVSLVIAKTSIQLNEYVYTLGVMVIVAVGLAVPAIIIKKCFPCLLGKRPFFCRPIN